jgi:hypothetical protein
MAFLFLLFIVVKKIKNENATPHPFVPILQNNIAR